MNVKICPQCLQCYGAGMLNVADFCWCCECDTIEHNISCNDADVIYIATGASKNQIRNSMILSKQ